MARADGLEKRLGYRFKSAPLLEQALTHRSFGAPHNERLEFLGDSVLGCVIAEVLCERYPGTPEGQLTRLRASLVREDSLASVARELRLAGALRLGETEAGRAAGVRASILADALEAVFGAVFLDGGYENARGAVLAAFAGALQRLEPGESVKDPKTRLQELLQARRLGLPRYRVVGLTGAAHEQRFEIECRIGELNLATAGRGTSRQRAEQDAAGKMLKRIES